MVRAHLYPVNMMWLSNHCPVKMLWLLNLLAELDFHMVCYLCASSSTVVVQMYSWISNDNKGDLWSRFCLLVCSVVVVMSG